jgi:GNAT superfamily N-acetyltransferase
LFIKVHPGNQRDDVFRNIRERDSVMVAFEPVPESSIGELAARFDICDGRRVKDTVAATPHMITRLHDLPLNHLRPLVEESRHDGYRFVQRLQDEWLSGANRFDGEGEAIFGYYAATMLVGVGGINRQSATSGRLRRFYVARDWRRKGVGRALVRHILSFAAQFYTEVVVHTESSSADTFYCALGFSRVPGSSDPTHRISIEQP